MNQHPHADPPQRKDLLAAALLKFPRLAQHAGDYSVIQGRPMIAGDDRQLESYSPGESWNPVPGKATTELYNDQVPQNQQVDLVAGDMLHHLANVDPQWAQMKAGVAPPQMTPQRQDEFLMGYITPDAQNDWMSHYTPEQKTKLQIMVDYLKNGGPK